MTSEVSHWNCPSWCQTHSWCLSVTQGQVVVWLLLNGANQHEQAMLFLPRCAVPSPISHQCPSLKVCFSPMHVVGGRGLGPGGCATWGAKPRTLIWNQRYSTGRCWEQSACSDSSLIRWAILCYYQNHLWGDLSYMPNGEHILIESWGLETLLLPVTSYICAISSAKK